MFCDNPNKETEFEPSLAVIVSGCGIELPLPIEFASIVCEVGVTWNSMFGAAFLDLV